MEAEANAAALGGRAADALRLYGQAFNEAKTVEEKARILAARADTLLSLDMARRAFKDAESALAIIPNYAPALLAKGMALEAEGRVEEARGIYLFGASLHGREPLMILKLFQNALVASTKPTPTTTTNTITTTTTPTISSTPTIAPPAAQVHQVPTAHTVAIPIAVTHQVTSIPAQSLIPTDPASVPSLASGAAPDPEPQMQLGTSPARFNGPAGAPALKADEIIALQSALQRSGDGVEEKVALGYMQVNRGNFVAAIAMFTSILATHPKNVGALLGRGTAYALGQELEKADADFTTAIAADQTCADAWKRRGQVRAARNQDSEALVDLSTAVQLDKTGDEELLHQRGLVWYKLRNFRRAIEDFRKSAISLRPDSLHRKQSYNHLGLCLNTIGDPTAGIEALQEALKIDPNYKEAVCGGYLF